VCLDALVLAELRGWYSLSAWCLLEEIKRSEVWAYRPGHAIVLVLQRAGPRLLSGAGKPRPYGVLLWEIRARGNRMRQRAGCARSSCKVNSRSGE